MKMRKKSLLLFAIALWVQITQAQSFQEADSIVTIFAKLPFNQAPKWITVSAVDGQAIVEGDIILGKIQDLANPVGESNVYCDVCQLWPNSTIPYVIAPGFTVQMLNEINLAINQINNTTNLCVIPRTNQSDYVKLVSFPACNSQVGKVGGEQIINLNDIGDDNYGCWKNSIIHEIFHAAGLWHTHSREDRNNFVIWNEQNTIPAEKHNFNQHIVDGFDIGAYDYYSIMHYGPFFFTSNNLPTLTRLNGSTDLGQGNDPTPGDIMTINYLYATKCNQCGISQSGSLATDPVFHIEFPESGGWTAFSPPGDVFGPGKFGKFDAGRFFLLDAAFGLPTTFEAGSVIEIYIDGCFGK